MTMVDADYFDRWYTNIAQSPARDSIVRRALGLPPELQSTSLLGWDAIAEVVTALGLREGQTLLDLACGRGGYGLEIITRTGARVVGVDFSRVAVQQAQSQAKARGLGDRANYVVRDIADTGLSAHSMDGIVCVDAIQFAEPVASTLIECRRVLRPGGCVVLTSWQFVERADTLSNGRVRFHDLAPELKAAGFERVQIFDKPAWRTAERTMWLAARSTDVGDDPALRSLRDEAREALAVFDLQRRVLATATAPS